MQAFLKVSTKNCTFDCEQKGGVVICWTPLNAQKFENAAEVKAVPFSKANSKATENLFQLENRSSAVMQLI